MPTPQQIERIEKIRKGYKHNMNNQQIAEQLGVTRQYIQQLAKRYNIKRKVKKIIVL